MNGQDGRIINVSKHACNIVFRRMNNYRVDGFYIERLPTLCASTQENLNYAFQRLRAAP